MNDDLTLEQIKEQDFSPLVNKNAISIVKQADGNWRGFMWKGDKLVQARQSDPMIVVQMLITHD